MNQMTVYEQFREQLYQENLRGAWEFESMRYGLMARLGLDESDALELACKIVAVDSNAVSNKQPKNKQRLPNGEALQG